MAKTSQKASQGKRISPALTPEAREGQLISLAIDQAEEMLENHTAPAQIVAHFLKLGTTQARLELEKAKLENKLIEAKTEALQAEKLAGEAYIEAIEAMRVYSGNRNNNGYD